MADSSQAAPPVITIRDIWLEVRGLRDDLAEERTQQALTSQQVRTNTAALADQHKRLAVVEGWRLRVLGAAAVISAVIGAVVALAAATMQAHGRP